MDKMLLDMRHGNEAEYDRILEEIYICIMGPHFNEELAMGAVECMENTDGTIGEHWSLDQTTKAAQQNGIAFTHFNMYDWYYVLNMMYSDFFPVFGSDSNTYIKLSRAWLEDPDVPEGKALRYYMDVVKA
jgi:hypothetical protein